MQIVSYSELRVVQPGEINPLLPARYDSGAYFWKPLLDIAAGLDSLKTLKIDDFDSVFSTVNDERRVPCPVGLRDEYPSRASKLVDMCVRDVDVDDIGIAP